MLLEPQLKKIKEFKGKEVVPSLPGDTGIWESHPDPWEQIRDTSPEVSSMLSVTPLLAAVCKPVCWVECRANAIPCSFVPFSYLEVDQMLLHCAVSLFSALTIPVGLPW